MTSEKKWTALFVCLISFWVLVLGSTLYPIISGDQPLVDHSLNLTNLTLPILIFVMAYAMTLIFIFIAYLFVFDKVKQEHQHAIKSYRTSGNGQMDSLCSVIIPARNEQWVIKNTILKCLEQTYQNLEIIVVCHNCTDQTYEQASLVNDNRVSVHRLITKESGKGIALNFGVDHSRGEFILVLDSDGLLSVDFVENAVAMLIQGNYAAVQGRYIPSNRNFNFITRMLGLEGDLWSTPYMTIRHFFGKKTPLGGTGYIVRRDVLQKVGMFANHLVDDYELTFRLLRAKYQIGFAPLCINYDEKPPTLDSMLRQRARWGRGFISLMRERLAEPSDLIGNIYWMNPLAAICGLLLLLIPAYAAVHNIIFGYYPYVYTFLPLNAWLVLTATTVCLQVAVLIKQHNKRGILYALQVPVLVPFSHYWFASFAKAFTIKSWANTKTTHGFLDLPREKVLTGAT